MACHEVELLLAKYRNELRSFIRGHASPSLLTCETVDDLLQGVATRALEAADGFEARGEAQGRAWIYRVTRALLVDRVRYWTALKRRSTQVLRFEYSRAGAEQSGMFFDPAASQTSPSQFAIRREQLILAAKALDLLMERDRDLITWAAQEMPLKDQALKLDISYEAAAQASLRAQERFRKVLTLVQNSA
jgi:RNA polymerase sigma factor (sigma-70 family)